VPYRWLDLALEQLRGVEPFEVIQALANPQRLALQAHAQLRLVAIIARTHAGRPLVVVVRLDQGFTQWIVQARDPRPDELTRVQQWEATR
jgi:hypothetical protein